MDTSAAEVAFSSHMLKARSKDGTDPGAATEERRHALELAEHFGGPQQIAEACGALCWSETVVFGAPVTERFLRRGLELGRSTGLYLSRFLVFEALYQMERGELDVAEERFTEALELHGPDVGDIRAGLGTLTLRAGRFEEARQHFVLALGGGDRAGDLRALDGQAEAERALGDDRAATASSSRVLELTASAGPNANRAARRYRTRALNSLGLIRWRAGVENEALECFRRALELWPEQEERWRTADALIALERYQFLRHTVPPALPLEASPGDTWAVGFLRLGRALTPVHLPESPPSPQRVEQLRALRSGDAFNEALRPVLGEQTGDAWFVSRVRSVRAFRCVLLDLVPNESAR